KGGTDTEHVTYFSNKNKLNLLDEALKRWRVPESSRQQAALLLMPLASLLQQRLGLTHETQEVLGARLRAPNSFDALADLLWSNLNAFELAGRYVLVLTDCGRVYRASLVQTLVHGDVVEVREPRAIPERFAVTYPWLPANLRRADLLGEFEALVNGKKVSEAD